MVQSMSLLRKIDAVLQPTTQVLRLILGDQLNASHSWFQNQDHDVVYLIAELKQETNYVKHHVQKVCAFFSAMEQFAVALSKSKHQVLYLTLDETKTFSDLPALLHEIITTHHIKKCEYQQPDEYRLAQQLELFRVDNVEIHKMDSEHFLLPYGDINNEFKKDKNIKMEFFYRRMRKKFHILMDGKEPTGGQWNYDTENRGSLKKSDLANIPQPLMFSNNVKHILTRIDKHNIETIGKSEDNLLWPTNRLQSRQLLSFFCTHLLVNFGKFQDAMTAQGDEQWSLYHSRLSFALNSKMISPKEVINTVLQYWEEHQDSISINQVEGFVRQILGWREYVRGIYWANMPEYASKNSLQANRPLPDYFWHGQTQMRCMHKTISQSLEYAYAHHIQRLMITGNFCLLTAINPNHVDAWYLGIYIDAIEWVEMPNTRGMTQFADGGIVATKPYAASGSYIHKMSDYCNDCYYNVTLKTEDNACPFNSLYWHFIDRHKDKLEKNPRMNMIYGNWKKMNADKKILILEKAQSLLDNLNSL